MLYYQDLLYILKIVCPKLISRYHNNLLLSHSQIKKTQKLIAEKYYWLTLQQDVKVYVKDYNFDLILKIIRHKLYNDLQFLLIPTHQKEDLFMDFVTALSISTNRKSENYNSTLVIIEYLIKMFYYKLVKVTMNRLGLYNDLVT